jgi:SAM-dependent methyltransferase
MYSDHGIDHQRMAMGICDAVVESFKLHGGSMDLPFRLLDIGCANGFLLGEVKRRYKHADVVGVEPSPVSALKAKRLFDVDVHVGTLNTFASSGSTFDFVTILGNLQLHENPFQTLSKAHELLRPGGLLLCQFKNPFCSARVLGRWASKTPMLKHSRITKLVFERGFACMRHSGSKSTLRTAIERTGLRVLSTITIAPRMLAWTDGKKAHAAGVKGVVWNVLDKLDQMTDQRAWIEFVCQKPDEVG